MIGFQHYQFLWLLLLPLVMLAAFAIVSAIRRRQIASIGDKPLVREMMPHYSRGKSVARVILLCIAVFFAVLALARPRSGARISQKETRGAEIIICLDVSNSMLAQDYSPCRLDRAKLAVSKLVDKLQGDRIGLIIFAGQAFVQLPVTTDFISAKMFLSQISQNSVPVQGTAIGDAINTAIKSFSAQSEKSRVIVVISDGENHEDDAVAAARQASEMGIKVYSIGVGSQQGQPIPMDGELLKDSNGEIVVTRLDEDGLRKIAEAGQGAYIHATDEEFGLNPIIDEIKRLEDERFNSIVFEEYDEQYMYFLAVAIAALVLSMLIGFRKSDRRLFQ